MQTDEKKASEDNLRDLQTAQSQLLGYSKSQRSCFETAIKLNRAALAMCNSDELDENDIAALAEVLSIQSVQLESAYAHYRMVQ